MVWRLDNCHSTLDVFQRLLYSCRWNAQWQRYGCSHSRSVGNSQFHRYVSTSAMLLFLHETNRFEFLTCSGTSVDVYGIAPASSTPPASYTIDDSSAVNVSMPADIGGPSPAFNWHYISAPLSSGGNHTLVITSHIENSFFIDYILVASDTAFVPPLTAAEKGAGIPTTSSPTSEATTATSLPIPSNPSKKSEIVVGSVVGTVSLVFLLVLGVFLLRRRRRPKSYRLDGQLVHDAGSPPRGTSYLFSSL